MFTWTLIYNSNEVYVCLTFLFSLTIWSYILTKYIYIYIYTLKINWVLILNKEIVYPSILYIGFCKLFFYSKYRNKSKKKLKKNTPKSIRLFASNIYCFHNKNELHSTTYKPCHKIFFLANTILKLFIDLFFNQLRTKLKDIKIT